MRTHRTNPKSTLQAEFVLCEHFFLQSQTQQGLTIMATQVSACRTAIESTTQRTSHRPLECRHTGQIRKAHCKLNSLYAGIFSDSPAQPQESLTLIASQACARRTEIDSSAQQTSLRHLECRHTGQTRKAQCKPKSLYAGIFQTGFLSKASREIRSPKLAPAAQRKRALHRTLYSGS